MKKLFFILFALFCLCGGSILAQRNCGYEYVHKKALEYNPDFDKDRQQIISGLSKFSAARKTAGTPTTLYVPIVFHIVLNSSQLTQLDPATITDRINTQIQVLNEDYDRGNADSVDIPTAFKQLYQSTNIKFALTHKDPSGNYTPGYEIVNTTSSGFDYTTQDAKHSSKGGADAWDVTKYINVWVINFSPATVIGLTVAPSYTISGGYATDEMGIQICYGTFGRRTSPGEYFLPYGSGTPFDKGRTLSHEMGHFFEMIHVWGDDGGLCPGSGGSDDGIPDTPPQADHTYGCPTYPLVDACSGAPNGIMFMNFMDYTDDACMHMFTRDQDSVMYSQLLPGGESYSLTTHHDLLEVPENFSPTEIDFIVSPNPTSGNITVTFINKPYALQSIKVLNTLGQQVKYISATQSSVYAIDLTSMAKGMYFVECNYATGKEVRKILLQ
jgi:hypothetical protein